MSTLSGFGIAFVSFVFAVFFAVKSETSALKLAGRLGLKKLAQKDENRNFVDVAILAIAFFCILTSFFLISKFYSFFGISGRKWVLIAYAILDLNNGFLGAVYLSKDPINNQIAVNRVRTEPLSFSIHPEEINAVFIGRIIGFIQAFFLVWQKIF